MVETLKGGPDDEDRADKDRARLLMSVMSVRNGATDDQQSGGIRTSRIF